MSMKRYKRAVANCGQYTTPGGETKNRYQNVGTLFKRDDGSVTLKMESLPVGGEWNGWINFYDIDEKRKEQPRQQRAPAPQQDYEDDIPF